MEPEQQNRIDLIAGDVYRPGTSIKALDVFAGRKPQIRQVMDTISQEGRSVLIYGERGVGKTSLANVIEHLYRSVKNARIFAPHIACDKAVRHPEFRAASKRLLRPGSRPSSAC